MNDQSCSYHEMENYLITHQGVHACQICTCANHAETDASQKVTVPRHSSLHERIQMTKARTHTHQSTLDCEHRKTRLRVIYSVSMVTL